MKNNAEILPLPPEGNLGKPEEAALRTALQAWIFSDVSESSIASPEEARTAVLVANPETPRNRLADLQPVARIPAQPQQPVPFSAPPQPSPARFWIPLGAAALLLVGVGIYQRFVPPPLMQPVSQNNSPTDSVPDSNDAVPIVVPRDPGISRVAPEKAPERAPLVTAPREERSAPRPAIGEPTIAKAAPAPRNNPAVVTTPERSVKAPPLAQPNPEPAALAEAAPVKNTPRPATIPVNKLPGARKNDDGLGSRIESLQFWSTLGNLPVFTMPDHVEINTRNDSETQRAGGMVCQRPFDLTQSGISLSLSAANLSLSAQKDFEFFVIDEPKAGKDARMPNGNASISLRRVRTKIDPQAARQRLEFVVTRAGDGIRQEVRLDGKTVLTRVDEHLRDLRRVFVGFRATSQSDPTGSTVSIEDIGVACRPKTVAWAASVEDAQKIAQDHGEPYGIFFCDAATAKVAGDGQKVLGEYRKSFGSVPPPTIFETPLVLGEFQSAGVYSFYKAAAEVPNADLYKSYNAAPGTLVLCAPDGSRLATFDSDNCKQTPVVKYLTHRLKEDLHDWRVRPQPVVKAVQSPVLPRIEPDVLVPAKAPASAAPAHAALKNAFRIVPNLFAGPPPASESDFTALHELGVRTILRVDGSVPDAERLARAKFRAVHLPMGFRDISPATTLTLAKALRDLAPLYIASSEGYRAEAAAVLASVGLGVIESADASTILASTGVPTSYSGLFSAVKSAAKAEPAMIEALNVDFSSQQPVKPMVRVMLELDSIWKRVESARAENWKSSAERKEGSVERDASLLLERYLAMGQLDALADQPAALREVLSESVASSASFTYSLGALKKDPTPENLAATNTAFRRVMNACNNCHATFRDSQPRK